MISGILLALSCRIDYTAPPTWPTYKRLPNIILPQLKYPAMPALPSRVRCSFEVPLETITRKHALCCEFKTRLTLGCFT
ncbi:hypothetical protein B5X24_HaOG212999 [Helicoverpa armigera]|nr:hypothetical protein B5X24_HaOG212999 [Helicoverpa armigera]